MTTTIHWSCRTNRYYLDMTERLFLLEIKCRFSRELTITVTDKAIKACQHYGIFLQFALIDKWSMIYYRNTTKLKGNSQLDFWFIHLFRFISNLLQSLLSYPNKISIHVHKTKQQFNAPTCRQLISRTVKTVDCPFLD